MKFWVWSQIFIQNVDYVNWLTSKYKQGNVQVRQSLGNYQDDTSATLNEHQ